MKQNDVTSVHRTYSLQQIQGNYTKMNIKLCPYAHARRFNFDGQKTLESEKKPGEVQQKQ